MIAIAISFLIGLTAFAAISIIYAMTSRGFAAANAMLAEVAEIDARRGVRMKARARPFAKRASVAVA